MCMVCIQSVDSSTSEKYIFHISCCNVGTKIITYHMIKTSISVAFSSYCMFVSWYLNTPRTHTHTVYAS